MPALLLSHAAVSEREHAERGFPKKLEYVISIRTTSRRLRALYLRSLYRLHSTKSPAHWRVSGNKALRMNTAASATAGIPAMHRDNLAPIALPNIPVASSETFALHTPMQPDLCTKPPLVWDWDIEHADRKEEAKADAAIHGHPPFQVDRKLLKDIVQERMGTDVVRVRFLGAGECLHR